MLASSPTKQRPDELSQPETASPTQDDRRDADGAKNVETNLVTEAYIKVNEVFYGWAKWLNPWQVNAVKALTNPNSLTHPAHPLYNQERGGLELFNCTKEGGHETLCFSLKQVEYLQYYIHEMRLAEPAWTIYLGKLSSADDTDQPKAGEKVEPPPYVEDENPWVPITSAITPGTDFVDVESMVFGESREIKRFTNAQAKRNKVIDRDALLMKDLSAEERNKLEAQIDNETPGPGLRRGPPRRHERKPDNRQERQEGTGWGGFPLKGTEDTPDDPASPSNVEASAGEPQNTEEALPGTLHTGQSSDQGARRRSAGDSDTPIPSLDIPLDRPGAADPDTAVAKDEPISSGADTETAAQTEEAVDPDDLAQHMNRLRQLSEKLADEKTALDVSPTAQTQTETEDALERYYHDAQQAFLLASAGGLVEALAAKEEEDQDAEGGKNPEVPAEIGRSLFFALHLVTWEEDENVVLELGWAATWWQEKLNNDDTGTREERNIEKAGEAETDDDEDRFERMTEHGHIIVQDHLLDKHNGHLKPDERSRFHFGASLPLSSIEANQAVKEKLRELSKRAGGGPTYLLLHSADSTESDFKKISWKTANWEKQIRPAGWQYPSYASEEGVGKVFVLDTAVLFGAIEDDQSVQPALGRTRKSLGTVAQIMFGAIPELAPKACGNAGNYAAYCLQVFSGIVDGPRLEILRVDYRQSQLPVASGPAEETADAVKSAASSADQDNEKPLRADLADRKSDFERAMAMKAESKAGPALASTATSLERNQPDTPAELDEEQDTPLAQDGMYATKAVRENSGGTGDIRDEEEEDEDCDRAIAAVYYEDAEGKMIEL